MEQKPYTEQNCKDIGISIGMPEEKAVIFFHYYNAQDWFFNSGLKITNLKSAMWRWKNNQYRFEKPEEKKSRNLKQQDEKQRARNREEYEVYLMSKNTKALQDLKKGKGHLWGVCGWLIEEILAKRK